MRNQKFFEGEKDHNNAVEEHLPHLTPPPSKKEKKKKRIYLKDAQKDEKSNTHDI